MIDRSQREMEESVANVRITSRHFNEAFERVRVSLDKCTREKYERQVWNILYNQDHRDIL